MMPLISNKPELFTLGDSEDTYLGYRRVGMTWNGFQCPLFTIETVRAIARMTQEYALEMPGEDIEVVIVDDEDRVWIRTMCNAKPVTDATEHHAHATKYGRLYAIGSFGWTWDVIPPSHPCESCGESVVEGEHCGNDRPDGTSEYLCGDCYKPAEEAQMKPTDIIAHTSIRLFLNGDREDFYNRSQLIVDVMSASREFCIDWLASNDRNGIYRDADLLDEDREPMTAPEARALLIATLLED